MPNSRSLPTLIQYKTGLKEDLRCCGLIVSMSEAKKLSAEQIEAFLAGSQEHRFRGKQRSEVYEWITRTLRVQEYRTQGKKMRGLLRRYVEKMTGRSRTQVTLLIARYMKHSEVKVTSYRRHSFASRFTRADVELLAQVDEAHETLSGPATKKILEREFREYKHAAYSGWREFQWRTFTTYASVRAIGSAA